jgi:ketosteroid isomerase-like protein
MADEDLANLRRAFDAFNARFPWLKEHGIEAYYAEFYDDEAVVESADGFPAPMRHQGVDGFRTYFEEAYGPFEDVRFHVESLERHGEKLMARTRVSGRFVGDPTELEVRVAIVYDMRGGRIARALVYRSPERALADLQDG